jgi:hypothetical protein
MEKRKHGQITMFIILGIIIFVSFLFLFFVSDFLSVEQLEQQREIITEQPFETSQVQYFTSVCVDDALKTGLLLLGKQGGFIYESQGGIDTPEELLMLSERVGPHDVTSVGVSIAARPQAPPPLYPCLEAYLGKDPVFCKHGMLPSIVNYGGVVLPPLEGGAFSIEGHLSQYIALYVVDCVDIATFATDIGFEAYNLKALGDVEVELTFLDTEVEARVAYPIAVDLGDNPVTQFVHFETTVPIRFKNLYQAIRDLARKDITNETFEIDVHYAQPKFTVNSARENEAVKFATLSPIPLLRKESSGFNDVFIIEDPISIIEAQPYEFRLGRKNRAPALHFLQWNASYWYDTADEAKEFCADCYDFLVIQGHDALITWDTAQRNSVGDIINHNPTNGKWALTSYDPDDDAATISFNGPLGTLAPLTFTPDAITPGIYKQTIIATDGDKEDTQEVRVLVDENLVAGIQVENYYGDAIISPEDPFQLDARVGTQGVKDQTHDDFTTHRFDWDVFAATAGFSSRECSQLPFVELGVEYPVCDFSNVPDIETITTLTLDSPHQWRSQIKTAGRRGVIDLDVTREYSNRIINSFAQLQVDVVPCIVHGSNDNPWPYNLGNPYLAEHTCCAGDPANPSTWRVRGSSEVCYRDQRCDATGYLLADYVHLCDGKRGNICGTDGIINSQTITPLKCGVSEANDKYQTCSNIPLRCAEESPWSVANGVWCFGRFGCSEECTEGEIVDVTRTTWDRAVNPDNDQRFKCGCTYVRRGKACQKTTSPFDDGVCGTISFIPPSNTVGECV